MMDAPAPDRVSVLIPAAGTGERLGRGPKAQLLLHGRPVLHWVVDKARQLGAEIIVAAVPGVDVPPECIRIAGGATRQASVRALAHVATRPWCLVWDAARPFCSVAHARAVLAAAHETGAASPCLAAELPHMVVRDGHVTAVHAASDFHASQAPQACRTDLLRDACERAERDGLQAQSTASVLLHAGVPMRAVAGEKLNIKLTTAEDWLLAQALLAQLQS